MNITIDVHVLEIVDLLLSFEMAESVELRFSILAVGTNELGERLELFIFPPFTVFCNLRI